VFHSCIFPCVENTLDVWFCVGDTLDVWFCVGNTLDELCVGNTLDVWFGFQHLNIINRSFTNTSFSSDKRSDWVSAITNVFFHQLNLKHDFGNEGEANSCVITSEISNLPFNGRWDFARLSEVQWMTGCF